MGWSIGYDNTRSLKFWNCATGGEIPDFTTPDWCPELQPRYEHETKTHKFIISAESYFRYCEICEILGVDRNNGAVFAPEYQAAGSNGLREQLLGIRASSFSLVGYFSSLERFYLTKNSLTEPSKPSHPVEKFFVKHYSSEERPIIKGNGFDGLEIGSDREEAQAFIDFINKLIEERIGDVGVKPHGRVAAILQIKDHYLKHIDLSITPLNNDAHPQKS